MIADCFQQSTVLPFRFGTVFNDDESLRKSIRSNQRQFLGNIDKLRGKTEMHLKIFVDDCCGSEIERHLASDSVGREYLSNLRENASRARERQTRARAVSFQMHRLFLPLDEEVSCRLTENGKMVLDVAHLIDRKCVERYQNKFVTTSAMMRDCQMQLSGPWPPYHFVHRLTRTVHAQLKPQQRRQPQHRHRLRHRRFWLWSRQRRLHKKLSESAAITRSGRISGADPISITLELVASIPL